MSFSLSEFFAALGELAGGDQETGHCIFFSPSLAKYCYGDIVFKIDLMLGRVLRFCIPEANNFSQDLDEIFSSWSKNSK